MSTWSRRDCLELTGRAAAAFACGGATLAASPAYALSPKIGRRAERWVGKLASPTTRRSERAEGVLFLGRFRDPIYFLTSPIVWQPNPDQVARYQPVEVPIGFVTDFASIPRIFWSLLRPDGDYAHAAVVHDYMYWTQVHPRNVADEILRNDMQDLGVGSATFATIYRAVRVFGAIAWHDNAGLKARGERRVLKQFPTDPSITWDDWKSRPGVFA
jgi:hypothetical protein